MLKTISKTMLLVGVGTALSGCLLTENRDFNQAALDAAQISDDLAGLGSVDDDDLPTSGSANYTGVAAINYDERRDIGDENNDYFADIMFETDFESGDVEGSMSNFQSPDGAVSGELVLSNGQVFGDGVDGDFEGTITDDGDDITMDMDVNSDFVGDGTGEPAGLVGTLNGEYESDDRGDGEMLGSFVAEFDRP